MNDERQISSGQQGNLEEKKLTKRERRELRKQERCAEQINKVKRVKQRRMLMVVGAIAAVTMVVYGLYSMSAGSNISNAQEWSKGQADAAVTLVEYSDFQCPACQAYTGFVNSLLAKYPNDLKVIYRHYPLTTLHSNARLAAQAAEAAGKQEKFWEMHDLLFAGQGNWAEGDAKNIFLSYANELRLDVDQFTNDLDDRDVNAKINADIRSGNGERVNSTPTFLLNGKKIGPFNTFNEFQNLVESAIQELGNFTDTNNDAAIEPLVVDYIATSSAENATNTKAEGFDLSNF